MTHTLPTYNPLRSAYWRSVTDVAPLATFRVLFGLVACYGALRFVGEGWVETLLVEPGFFFDYYGFAWLPRPGRAAAYGLYGVIALSSLAVALGYRYRVAAPLFVLTFGYAQLLDATNYLNHYYLAGLLGALLCFVPAHGSCSLDVLSGRVAPRRTVPAWCVHAVLAQLALVYVFAGAAKLNSDWLTRAMPLAIWLPEHADVPVVGGLLAHPAAAYAASWLGAAYDLSIVGWLLWRPTRKLAYVAVVAFHVATGLLFNIGLFPLIMIAGTLTFFPAGAHRRWWARLTPNRPRAAALGVFGFGESPTTELEERLLRPPLPTRTPGPGGVAWATRLGLAAWFALQAILPLRALAYPGASAWTEEGYRYGWRVMLVEKAGAAEFRVVDGSTGRAAVVDPLAYLTPYQAKQMAIQPDFVLQLAHHVADDFAARHGFVAPSVYAEVHVSLNGRRSQRLVDPAVDLARVRDGLAPKTWILPHHE